MAQNPLSTLSAPPKKKQSSVEQVRELLRQYVSEYNKAENDLRIRWHENEEKYSKDARRADMQKMIDAEAKIKELYLPEKLIAKIQKHEYGKDGQMVHTGEWAYMASHYADYQKIKSGKKSSEALFSEIRTSKEEYGITGPTIAANAPAAAKEPQKSGFLSRIKEKASDFVNYMKRHPVKGGLLIGLAVLGVAVIIAASVFSGGGAAAVAAGGMAAVFGAGGATTVVGGIVVGGAITTVSGVMLAYDVKKDAFREKEFARIRGIQAAHNNTVTTSSFPSPIPEQSTHAWQNTHSETEHHELHPTAPTEEQSKLATMSLKSSLGNTVNPDLTKADSDTDSDSDSDSESRTRHI